MGGGGKGGSTRQTNTIDPRLTAAILNNNSQSQQVANNLGVRQFADFTPDQLAAFQGIRDSSQAGFGTMWNGIGAVNDAANYQPQMIDTSALGAQFQTAGPAAQAATASAGAAERARAAAIARGDIRDVSSRNFTDVNIGDYMDPYIGQVVDTTLSDLDRSRQVNQQQNAAQAARAGAFGGSRHGILEAETNRGFADVAGRTAAGLRSAGFNAAAGLATNDLNRELQAGMSNQNVDFGVAGQNANFSQQANLANAAQANQMAQYNAGLAQQANLANAANQNQMSMFNTGQLNQGAQFNAGLGMQGLLANQNAGLQGAGLNLQAGLGLGNMASQLQQMGLLGAGALGNIGSMQQQLEQQRLDAGRNLGMEQQQIRNASIGLMSPLAGNSTSTQQQNPGLMGMLGLGLQGLSLFSDERLKTDIAPMEGRKALKTLNFLNGNTYRYKDGTGLPTEPHGGVMAQDVEKVLPSAVSHPAGAGGMKAVDYAQLTGLLVEAVKELDQRTSKTKKATH